jgi:hypothetical protein
VTGTFLGMVDDEDGDAMAPLQLVQVRKQRRDFASGVFVDAVQPHEGIEDQQPWLQAGDGVGEAAPIGLEIEPERGSGDDLDIEIGKVDAGGDGDALEPPAHSGRGILGGIEEDTAGVGYRKTPQAGNTSSNGNGQIERQERPAALGLAADDADGSWDHRSVISQHSSAARSPRRQAGSTGRSVIAVVHKITGYRRRTGGAAAADLLHIHRQSFALGCSSSNKSSCAGSSPPSGAMDW